MVCRMLPDRRHQLILRALRTDGPTSVVSLAAKIGRARPRSGATSRSWRTRDCSSGSTAVRPPSWAQDDPFADVAGERVEAKDALAACCANLVRDGETVRSTLAPPPTGWPASCTAGP